MATFDSLPIPPSVYFGGCSWGAAFYIGVHKAMIERWGPDFYKHTLITGGSAGTVIGVMIALGFNNEQTDQVYRLLAERSINEGSIGTGARIIEEVLREALKSIPNVHEKLKNKCWMGTTSFPWKHKWHCSWSSIDDLMETMKGSYHIPFYTTSFINMIRGEEVVDGAYGFAGDDLPHGDETLYIGIDPHAEITKELTNNQMIFPSVGKPYDELVLAGYEAMMKWDGTMNKKVGYRTPNYQALYILWAMKAIEIPLRYIVTYLIYYPYTLLCLIYAGVTGRNVYLVLHIIALILAITIIHFL